MARPKTQDSKLMSFRLDIATIERLNNFCDKSGQTKTTAVRRAINAYIDDYNKKMEIIEKSENKA